jgi:HEAT repeat protein
MLEDVATSPSVDAVLRLLRDGQRPTAVQLTNLSGLSPADRAAVGDVLVTLPPDTRRSLLQRAVELAEDNVDLDFHGLAALLLDDEEAAIRQAAIEALWENRDRGIAGAISSLLRGDPDPAVRATAAAGLGPFVLDRELGTFHAPTGDHVVDALRAAIEDPLEEVSVRANALEAAAARSLPWVDGAIRDAFDHDDGRLRVGAVRAMGASAQERWIDYLEEVASADDPELRFEAANALGAIGSEDGIELLSDLLNDDDEEVVVAAVAALGAIGGEDAIEKLTTFRTRAGDGLLEAIDAALDQAKFLDGTGDSGVLPR